MRIFNTYSRRKEEIVPLEPGRIRMYSCGPTVYRYIHIGNLRTFCMADWLRRALVRRGYAVTHIKNITDVGHMRVERLDAGEDKVAAQARREGRTAAEIAAFYTRAFMHDEELLNILPADEFPRATQHVPEMIALIQRLERNGLTYTSGGNVYFDTHAFDRYGALSGNQFDAMQTGEQDATLTEKRRPEDFPLWKAAEPGREMAWDSPWGRGFPGWHIECSAMSMRYLGEQFDIHTGGVDNIFPHHENEIAQSEGAIGARWVSYWVHAQHLLADGLKMAKSVANDYTLTELMARGYEPLALRYLFTTAHYRSRLSFNFSALSAAQIALDRLRLAARSVADATIFPDAAILDTWNARFDAALDDDLNLPRAMETVWSLVRSHDPSIGAAEKCALLAAWDRVLGLDLFAAPPRHELPAAIDALRREQQQARAARDYARSDALRDRIIAAGYELRSTRDGDDSIVLPRRFDRQFRMISTSSHTIDHRADPDRFEWSINLIARNNRADLLRTLAGIARHASDRSIEIMIIDSGSTDDTLDALRDLARDPQLRTPDGRTLPITLIFADHNLGYAGGRNATLRASQGRYVVLLDTSIELDGDIWTALARTLDDPSVGVTGPYGLVTEDLREFAESHGPDVDAIEGYLIAFRRELLRDIDLIDEKFRFYRLADIFWSFFFKAAGLRAVVLPNVAERLIKHPHREYYSLTPEERVTKSKKNYDVFRDRWHHGESLLVLNEPRTQRWRGHDDDRHIEATHTHDPAELPPAGQPHRHAHRHLADHEHTHWHYHHPSDESAVTHE